MNDDLIARLERATEGSRELDAEIAVAVRSLDTEGDKSLPKWAGKNYPIWRARPDGRVECVHTDGTGSLNWSPLHYTTSIDAALSLVPEPKKLAWGVGTMKRDGDPKITYAANCRRFGRIDAGQPLFDAEAATPALALCIAALRARR